MHRARTLDRRSTSLEARRFSEHPGMSGFCEVHRGDGGESRSIRKSMYALTAGVMPRRVGNTACTIRSCAVQSGNTRTKAPLSMAGWQACSGTKAMPSPSRTALSMTAQLLHMSRGFIQISRSCLPGPTSSQRCDAAQSTRLRVDRPGNASGWSSSPTDAR